MIIALVLNLKIGGRDARDIGLQAWNNPSVQKIYREIKTRVLAVVRKDISVEEAFKTVAPKTEQPKAESVDKSRTQVIDLDRLDEKDKAELKKILDKAAQ